MMTYLCSTTYLTSNTGRNCTIAMSVSMVALHEKAQATPSGHQLQLAYSRREWMNSYYKWSWVLIQMPPENITGLAQK